MTANEARREMDRYMAAPMDDELTQVNAITALFTMVAELQRTAAIRDENIVNLKTLIGQLIRRVDELELEQFGMVKS